MSTSQGSSARERSVTVKQQCSGRWPGVCSDRQHDLAELDPLPVVERLCGVLRLGGAVNRDGQAELEREPTVAGDVVGVGVGLEDAREAHAAASHSASTSSTASGGSTTTASPAALVADEVGGAAQILVDELPEQHAPTLAPPLG